MKRLLVFAALLLAPLAAAVVCAQDKSPVGPPNSTSGVPGVAAKDTPTLTPQLPAKATPLAVRSYPTADGRQIVRHDAKDEGLYFDVPANEVAYNVQILRRGAEGYATVYHGEPRKSPGKPGDAIKAALASSVFGFTMPAARWFAIHSDPLDSLSALYSPPDAWGGAGNPMVVKGTAEDPFYYIFFLSVVDDNHDWSGTDFRHVVCQARTRDFRQYDLLAEGEGRIEWEPFQADTPAAWRRPWVLRDETGERICSRFAADPHSTQGLIGSICFHDNRYYFFYTDRDSDGKAYLFVRCAPSLVGLSGGRTSWSAATRLSGPLPGGIIIRVAKARDGARWAALYNGYRAGPAGTGADLFLQYTGDLSLTGPQGLAGLRWFDDGGENPANASVWLGLQSGGGNFSQHCFLTDPYGNLTVTEQDDRAPDVGGMLTWADFTRGVYGGQVFWAKWTICPADAGAQEKPRLDHIAGQPADVAPSSVADSKPTRQFILVNRVPGPVSREGFAEIRRALPDVAGANVRVGIGYIFSYFQSSPDQTAAALRQVLQAAEETGTPVLIQLDGENWWDGRPDLWNWWDASLPGFDPANRENVEWSGWSSEQALKLAWRNWGRQLRVRPPPNLVSARYRRACHEQMAQLISVILKWWRALPAEKQELLVGIKLGHESSIGVNAWYYPNGNDLLDRPEQGDPATGLRADELPSRGVATIGYAAVRTAGIREQGELTEADLAEVVKRHLDDLCREAARLGVPREKLFTHIAGWKEGEALYGAGVNQSSCPGWSFYKHAADPRQDTGVQAALKRSDAPWWAATEWLFQGPSETKLWRQALENTLADPRCRYLCIYNWEGIRDNAAALEAIRQAVAASAGEGRVTQ